MKYRIDFITNSSTAEWVVKNITNTTKTMWDLMVEAAAGDWELVSWPHYGERGRGDKLHPLPRNPKRLQEFKEQVAKLETFPPHTIVTITIAWGDGGPIYCPNGLRWTTTRSFKIIDTFC